MAPARSHAYVRFKQSATKPKTTIASRMSGYDDAWLEKTKEDMLDPDLAICDPHHHLWDFPTYPYLLKEILADTNSGHKIESTVFLECTASFRADGPEEMRCSARRSS